jgi:hypothetical protein
MSGKGLSMYGIGSAKGTDRAKAAARAAIDSPLLEDAKLENASGILVTITSGVDLTLGEFSQVGELLEDIVPDSAILVIGSVIDSAMTNMLKVTIVATGLNHSTPKQLSKTKSLLSSPETPAYLDIPSFLRLSESPSRVKPDVTTNLKPGIPSCKVIANSDVSDDELAELINHLSNVYRSVGGDELIITSVNDLPPNSQANQKTSPIKKTGSSR